MSVAVPFAPHRPVDVRVDELIHRLRRLTDVATDEIQVVSAPLRICPLGAHIDHQLGVVTGMAIDQAVLMAFAPSGDGRVQVESENFPGQLDFVLDDIPPFVRGDWGNYLRGAALAMRNRHGIKQGVVGVIDSDMPVGGLSSSAAVTIAYLAAFQAVNHLPPDPRETVDLVTATEHDYIGLQNGILDQSSILFSRRQMLTRIDCRTLEIDRISTPLREEEVAILIVYSGIAEGLMGTGYNRRVAECEESAQMLSRYGAQAATRLREVDPGLFDEFGHRLPDPLRRRAAHYFGEMARVSAGIEAWQQGDIATFGRLINESGYSSIHNYECGSPGLITLYDILAHAPGVHGARFSGAGFRGNCLALVDPEQAAAVAEQVHARYPAAHPEFARTYSVHLCRSADGARLLP